MKSILLASAVASAMSVDTSESYHEALNEQASSFMRYIDSQEDLSQRKLGSSVPSGIVPQSWIIKETNLFYTDETCSTPDDATFGFNLGFCEASGATTSSNKYCRQVNDNAIQILYYTYDKSADCSTNGFNYRNSSIIDTTVCGEVFNAKCSYTPQPWASGYSGAMKQYFRDEVCSPQCLNSYY